MDIYPGYPYTKVIFISEGETLLFVDGHQIPLSKHDLILINPGNSHFSITNKTSPVHLVSLGIENLVFPEITDHTKILSVKDDKEASIFSNLYRNIVKEAKDQGEDYSLACSMYLRILLVWLKRLFGITYSSVIKEKRGKDCSLVKDYLDKHYKENITLDILSMQSGMNKYYLVHSFTKLYGCSPISYLNEKRIEASKILLETTDMSIAQIAAQLGFSSQSYFSQSFKKNTYMTPNDYRKSTRLL